MTTPTVPSSNLNQINVLDLCAAAVACTVTAAECIQEIAAKQKNTRTKSDGSFVTDADFVAQGAIVQALQSQAGPALLIVGEESPEEMLQHQQEDRKLDPDIFAKTKQELLLRFQQGVTDENDSDNQSPFPEHWPLSAQSTDEIPTAFDTSGIPDLWIDADRLRVIVDPLDGTKSYARGDHDCVSILIALILDGKTPIFGVVGKPFGYGTLPGLLGRTCTTIYGGSWLGSGLACVAGVKEPLPPPPRPAQPRAVISASRSAGIVQDFCRHLGQLGLVSEEPLLVAGAGEKSVRILLGQSSEVLWFFPKPGTSLWDVAATDALLRVLGGVVTDKYGRPMDYSLPREEAENVHGVVACNQGDLHQKCIELFAADEWMNYEERQKQETSS